MTHNHLIGELSARLEQLQFVAGIRACDVMQLRQQVETSPVPAAGGEPGSAGAADAGGHW